MCIQQLQQLPFLGIQVEPVDLSVRPVGQLRPPGKAQRPESATRVDRRLWILPLAKSEPTEIKVGF